MTRRILFRRRDDAVLCGRGPTANAAPTISAQSIEVFENTDGTIGSVTASDDDVLLYSLWEEDDPAVTVPILTATVQNDGVDNDNGSFDHYG